MFSADALMLVDMLRLRYCAELGLDISRSTTLAIVAQAHRLNLRKCRPRQLRAAVSAELGL